MSKDRKFRKKINIDDFIEDEPGVSHNRTKVDTKNTKELTPTSNNGEHINFNVAMNEALKLFKDQSFVTENPEDITIEKIELTRARATSFLDALNNVVNITHLQEVITADNLKFRRREELSAMNPLLSSFKIAAEAGQKTMQALIIKLDFALGLMEKENNEFVEEVVVENVGKKNKYGHAFDDDPEMSFLAKNKKKINALELVTQVQKAYTLAVSNLTAVTAGLRELIKLERFSGARPWGNSRGMPNTIGYVKGLGRKNIGDDGDDDDPDDDGFGKPEGDGTPQRPRKMTSDELMQLAVKRRKEEELGN